jgi:2-polyprenyl-3-methyl-5-hydroxy-6-metoxy-1,4-benzoquinol methylase
LIDDVPRSHVHSIRHELYRGCDYFSIEKEIGAHMDDPLLKRHDLGYMEVANKPTQDELRKYYAERYFQTEQGNYRAAYGGAELNYIEAKIKQKAHVVLNHHKGNGGSLLDVGCGEGFAMAFFHRQGWKVEGLDFSSAGLLAMNPHLANMLTTGDVFSLLEERMDGSRRHDTIWLANVLEHVAEPVELLTKLRSLLTEDGMLVVTVPNDFSSVQKLLIDENHIDSSFWIALPDHLAYFNADSLKNIAAATGYATQKILGDFPIDWFLLHPGSNYVRDRSRGPAAHAARIQIENLLSALPIDAVNTFFEAMAAVGLGRQVTAFLTKNR